MNWLLIYFLLVPPYLITEVQHYATANDCLSQGEMLRITIPPEQKDFWDFYCMNEKTLEVEVPKR